MTGHKTPLFDKLRWVRDKSEVKKKVKEKEKERLRHR